MGSLGLLSAVWLLVFVIDHWPVKESNDLYGRYVCKSYLLSSVFIQVLSVSNYLRYFCHFMPSYHCSSLLFWILCTKYNFEKNLCKMWTQKCLEKKILSEYIFVCFFFTRNSFQSEMNVCGKLNSKDLNLELFNFLRKWIQFHFQVFLFLNLPSAGVSAV